jgi:hypothetical protein
MCLLRLLLDAAKYSLWMHAVSLIAMHLAFLAMAW